MDPSHRNSTLHRSDEENVTDYSLKVQTFLANPTPGDEIVISGISGSFPSSKNVYEFRDNLYNKVDMVKPNKRWGVTHPDLPSRTGLLPAIDNYDTGYFGLHDRQAKSLDPLSSNLHEKVIEAILDAGLQPSDFENTNTGVYIGSCLSENEKSCFFENKTSQYYAMTGTEKSMQAHRLSYLLKLKGPSICVDTACSSSLFAVEQAYRAIRLGEIDAAIVGGTNLCLLPFMTLQFARLGVLSRDGSSKSFDQRANGYVRSEAFVVIILQKVKDSKRVYARLCHVASNCDGFKEQGITFPSSSAQAELLTRFYQECGVEASSLSFLEAHGTGTAVGDPEECLAIDSVFTKGRKTPLLMGSVKSSIGHPEPTSGLCSMLRCILAMETGLIAPNIHLNQLNKNISGLIEGRMKVVLDAMPLQDDRGLMAVSNFGFGGANCHVLLKWNEKLKTNKGLPKDDLPRLVCVSGRTPEAVETLLDAVSQNEFDAEFVGLIHECFRNNIDNHLYRGYTIVSKLGQISRSSPNLQGVLKPLVIVFDELINWYHIGNQLIGLSPFQASMQRIQKILPAGCVDISEMLKDNKAPEKESVSDLGNIVVQIGIMDILHNMINVKPNSYIGHSSGELLSCYYNGLTTLEDILDNVVNNNSIINNNQATKYNGIGVNNHAHMNGNFNTKSLKPMLRKSQSQRFTTNILSMNGLNSNPNILKIGEGSVADFEDSNFLPMFEESNKNYLNSFLKCLGRLYEIGYNPQLSKLYPPIQFPVSRGTRMISPYIRWNHRRKKFVPLINLEYLTMAQRGVKQYKIQANQQWSYVTGHVIDGRNLFPATGYLYLAWETLSYITKVLIKDMSVVFENCRFIRATTIPSKGELILEVTVNVISGNFEVSEGDSVVVQGRIIMLDKKKTDCSIGNCDESLEHFDLPLNSKDVYKELRLRGYGYKGAFRAIEKSNVRGTRAQVRWDDNWVTFLDNLLQLKILQLDSRLLYVPVFIANITIYSKAHIALIQSETNEGEALILPVYSNHLTGSIRSGGVTISGLLAQSIPRKKDLGIPVLERYEFVPNNAELNTEQSVRVNMQIILENSLIYQVKAIEVIDEFTQEAVEPLSSTIKLALEAQPLVQPSVKILSKYPINSDVEVEDKGLTSETNCLLVIASGVSKRKNVLNEAVVSLKENGYIISREDRDFDAAFFDNFDVNVLTVHRNSEETLLLLQSKVKQEEPIYINVAFANHFSWVPQLQSDLKKNKDVVLYVGNEPTNGILGLTNCLRREPESKHVRCVFLMDEGKTFQSTETGLANQLKKNMAINVYKDHQWGTYRHLVLNNENTVEKEHCFVTIMKRGELSSLRWTEGPLSQHMTTDMEKMLIHVYYAALNFRDIMTATGKITADVITKNRLEQECVQGLEFSGRDSRGRRIMGMINCGALSSLVVADPYLCYHVPDSWTLEEAATVPAVYGTIIYALVVRGQMKSGESILIHSGSGGVGQAAIGFCLFHGCTVFTTVGTAGKREYLKNKFPALRDSHISNSHDESFEQMIFRETNGKGVDLVLNSLAEEKLIASVRCLARGGRMLEIGKYDLANNNYVNLRLLQKEASYQGVMLDQLFNDVPEKKMEVSHAFLRALKAGAIKPLNRNIFKYDEVEQAFRFMSTGKHMGKVLIKVRESEKELIFKPPCEKFTGLARYLCDSEKIYIVIGGLGGFGLELLDWLVLRGARKLIITSRKGISSGYQRMRIGLWKSYGAIVKISTAPVTTREGCKQLIEESLKLGRIDAIFNLAVVLEDAVFQNQTTDNFINSFGPKATATTYLDELTREMCPDLRRFVIFSSVSCGRGNAGQTNYGMANSVMERICERRKRDGFPALAIQWGAIGEVGLVADMIEENTEIEIGGTLQQKISSCLQVLDGFLTQRDHAIVSSMVVAEKKRASSSENIIDAVSSILGLNDLSAVSVHSTFAELGMDSMSGIEMKQVLERDFDLYLTAKEIRTLTFSKLKMVQEDKFSIEQAPESVDENFGLEMVFRLITVISVDDPYVQLKSKIEENSDATKIFFLPGIDGCAPVFETLASKLSGNLICLQYPCKPIPFSELVQSIASTIQTLLPKTEPFVVLAHSYGTMVALEVTDVLACKGYRTTIISLDGAPAQTLKMMQIFGVTSKSIFQTGLICHLVSIMKVDLTPAHKEFISQGNTWEERLERGLSLAKDKLGDQIDNARNVCNGIIWRIEGILSYNPSSKKPEATIKLYKAKRSLPGLEEDYSLSKIFGRPIDVEEIEGNHVTFLGNQQLAESIVGDLEKWKMDLQDLPEVNHLN